MKLTVISSYWGEVFKVWVTGEVLYLFNLPAMTFYNAQNDYFAIIQWDPDPVVYIDGSSSVNSINYSLVVPNK